MPRKIGGLEEKKDSGQKKRENIELLAGSQHEVPHFSFLTRKWLHYKNSLGGFSFVDENMLKVKITTSHKGFNVAQTTNLFWLEFEGYNDSQL